MNRDSLRRTLARVAMSDFKHGEDSMRICGTGGSRTRALLSFVLYLCSATAICRPAAATTPPYPRSTVITGVSWDLSAVPSLRKAVGSDIWPTAWAADGNLYGAWGDGGGFDDSQSSALASRASLGFALIDGVPQAGDPASFGGVNLWGQAPAYAQYQATFGGKVSEMFSVD